MKVWVTRDKTAKSIITIWASNKDIAMSSQGEWLSDEDKYVEINTEDAGWLLSFKILYGFTPRKGSIKQYNLELTEIKFDK